MIALTFLVTLYLFFGWVTLVVDEVISETENPLWIQISLFLFWPVQWAVFLIAILVSLTWKGITKSAELAGKRLRRTMGRAERENPTPEFNHFEPGQHYAPNQKP